MLYLLDTNIISALVDDPSGTVAKAIALHDQAEIVTTVIVAAELRYGLARRRSIRLTRLVEFALSGLDVLPFAPPADIVYGELRAQLDRRGTPIGAYDLLIAAHALAIDATLVTDNVREFGRVEGLRVENWLRPA